MHSENIPVMGSGQGTGWLPLILFLFADILLTAFDTNHHGLVMVFPAGDIGDARSREMMNSERGN